MVEEALLYYVDAYSEFLRHLTILYLRVRVCGWVSSKECSASPLTDKAVCAVHTYKTSHRYLTVIYFYQSLLYQVDGHLDLASASSRFPMIITTIILYLQAT